MKNRKLLLIVSLVLALTMSLGGTLAYLQDFDADVNTMVLGNVDIEQHEYQRAKDENGKYKTDKIDNQTSYVLEGFMQDKPLLPATELDANGKPYNFGAGNWDTTTVRMSQVDSQGGMQVFTSPLAVDKFVTVENTGKTDAYVRTLIAFELGAIAEANFDDVIGTSSFMTDDGVWNVTDCGTVEIKGNKYLVVEYIYNGGAHLGGVHAKGILPVGETTYPSLCQVYMKAAATNKDVVDLDGNANGKYDILVLSQAIQANGFDNAATAFKASFNNGADTVTKEMIQSWFEGDESTNVLPSTKTVMTLKELQDALDNVPSNTTITLGADIAGNVVYTQESEYTVLVDGNGYTFSGVFLVNGGSKQYPTAKLIIDDVNFVADSIDADAVVRLGDGTNDTRYTTNVTISNCKFDVKGAVAVKSYTGGDKNLVIENCTVSERMHSLCQLKNVEEGLIIRGCKVTAARGGNFNNCFSVTIEDCVFDVQKYAVRFGEGENPSESGYSETYLIKNSSLKSVNEGNDATIILRGTADNAVLTLDNTTVIGEPKLINTADGATVNGTY